MQKSERFFVKYFNTGTAKSVKEPLTALVRANAPEWCNSDIHTMHEFFNNLTLLEDKKH